MSRYLVIGLIVVFIVTCVGVSLIIMRGQEKSTIRLGCHVPLTGYLAKHGEWYLRGIKLAVKHFEEDYGYDVDLIIRDDESSPHRAAEVVEELCTVYNVHAIVGGYGSHIVGAASEVSERYRVVYVTNAGIADELINRGYRYFFRLNNLLSYARAQAGFCEMVGVKRVAIIYNTKVSTTDIAECVKSLLEEVGIDVVLFEGFPAGTTDFKTMLTKAMANGAEILICEGFIPDYVSCLRDCKLLGISLKAWIGFGGVVTNSFIRELGELSEYCYGTAPWARGAVAEDLRELEERFVRDYEAEYHEEPDYLVALGYSPTRILLEAVRRLVEMGRELTGDNIREELLKIDMKTLCGHVKFDGRGENIVATCLLCQIQGGKFVAVYPPERATGEPIYPAVSWGTIGKGQALSPPGLAAFSMVRIDVRAFN